MTTTRAMKINIVNTKGQHPRKILYMGTSLFIPATMKTTTPTGGVMHPTMMQRNGDHAELQGIEAHVHQDGIEDGEGDDQHRPDVHDHAQHEVQQDDHEHHDPLAEACLHDRVGDGGCDLARGEEGS